MKDWPHQAREFKRHREKKSRALIWPMRSGKSKACIDKACWQHGKGAIEGVIIIAPNGVHINWIQNEVPKWAWPENGRHVGFAWQTGRRADNAQIDKWRALLAHRGLKWFAINIEALEHHDNRKAVREFLKACNRKFMMIVSEAHHFGRPGAKRTFRARSLARHATFCTIESGTPLLNSPLRAFSQYELLEKEALGFRTFTEFQARYATYEKQKRNSGRDYWKLAEYKNMDELRSRLAPWSSVVLRSELHDMPALIRTERPVIMSEVQRRAYLTMVSHHLVEIEGTEVEALDGGARVQKLQQIINGYMMKDGCIVTVDPDAPIYWALKEQVDGTLPGKSLVWCRYREDIRRVVLFLQSHGYKNSILEYHGGVPQDQREPTRLAFQNNPRKLVQVGQPGAGGEGLDFSAADAVIYFSSIPDAIRIRQSEERATVKGGKTVSIVRITTPGTVDDRNWAIVDSKATLADSVSGRGLRDLLLATDV